MVYRSKKYNIYYVYNYILPSYSLKNRRFFEKYDFGVLAVWRLISLIK